MGAPRQMGRLSMQTSPWHYFAILHVGPCTLCNDCGKWWNRCWEAKPGWFQLAETRTLPLLAEQRVNQSCGCYLWWCSLTLRSQTSCAVVHFKLWQKEMWTPSIVFCSSRRPLFPTSLSVAVLDGSCTGLTTFCIQQLRANKNSQGSIGIGSWFMAVD